MKFTGCDNITVVIIEESFHCSKRHTQSLEVRCCVTCHLLSNVSEKKLEKEIDKADVAK